MLLDLYLTFFIIGGTSFGGGYAMLPTLQKVIAREKGWATEEELTDYFAIGQCTSGIIAVNVATFIGMKFLGIKGAIVATLGLVSPCIVIISAIGSVIARVSDDPAFASGFQGIKTCVAVMIVGSAYGLVKKAVIDSTTNKIFYLVFSAMMLNYLYPDLPPLVDLFTSPIALVVISAVVGCICYHNDLKETIEEGTS